MDWSTFYSQHTRPDIRDLIRVDPWQEQLAAKINSLKPHHVLEAGSGHGMTSLALSGKRCRRVLIDKENEALVQARQIFACQREEADFISGDLFHLPFADRVFDVVFNSGVLEHFEYTERREAVAEMLRVVKPSGTVLVGVPNHYSYPYRYAYLYRKKRNEWPYPEEHRVYDLSREIKSLDMPVTQKRETLSRKTALHFLRRHQRIFFRFLGLFRPYEGYLTILTLTRE